MSWPTEPVHLVQPWPDQIFAKCSTLFFCAEPYGRSMLVLEARSHFRDTIKPSLFNSFSGWISLIMDARTRWCRLHVRGKANLLTFRLYKHTAIQPKSKVWEDVVLLPHLMCVRGVGDSVKYFYYSKWLLFHHPSTSMSATISSRKWSRGTTWSRELHHLERCLSTSHMKSWMAFAMQLVGLHRHWRKSWRGLPTHWKKI